MKYMIMMYGSQQDYSMLAGDRAAAREAYLAAARRATSLPQQRYLHRRAARLAPDGTRTAED